ncbi:MAG TPA: hypothetical protein VL282_11005 [Tepidisphaeraceae bacterium]|jgi:hypothetical protein|nr:hypothetical protein [Tepidisphaeraceae bacterium]
MKRCWHIALICLAILLLASPILFAMEKVDAEKQLDAIKALAGTWVSEKPGQDGKPMTTIFKVTSGGTAVQEMLFAGSDHEMLDVYTVDGDKLVLTHYCIMGNQPRMVLKSSEKGKMNFEYVGGGNMKSRDESHMDSVELTIGGDKLAEKWTNMADGKVGEVVSFEFKRKS